MHTQGAHAPPASGIHTMMTARSWEPYHSRCYSEHHNGIEMAGAATTRSQQGTLAACRPPPHAHLDNVSAQAVLRDAEHDVALRIFRRPKALLGLQECVKVAQRGLCRACRALRQVARTPLWQGTIAEVFHNFILVYLKVTRCNVCANAFVTVSASAD